VLSGTDNQVESGKLKAIENRPNKVDQGTKHMGFKVSEVVDGY
jgi:hypothetical protein